MVMVIDEEKNCTLSKYASTKGKKKKISNDHNPILASFNIEYEKLPILLLSTKLKFFILILPPSGVLSSQNNEVLW